MTASAGVTGACMSSAAARSATESTALGSSRRAASIEAGPWSTESSGCRSGASLRGESLAAIIHDRRSDAHRLRRTGWAPAISAGRTLDSAGLAASVLNATAI